MFMVGLALVVQGLIDTRNFRDDISRIIQLQTNRQVAIKGNVVVSLLPVPTLYVPGVELRDARNENSTEPSVSVGMMRIQVSLLSLLSETPRITAISLERPVLQLVRGEDHLIHWGWLNAGLLRAMSDESTPSHAVALDVIDGRILLQDVKTEKNVAIENLRFNASNGSRLHAGGAFSFFGHAISFTLNSDSVSDSSRAQDAPFTFAMSSGDTSTLHMEGTMNFASEKPVIKGSMTMELEDAASWFQALEEEERGLLDAVSARRDDDAENMQFPLKMSGDWAQEGLTVDIHNLRIEGMNSAGIGDVSLRWKEWRPAIRTSLRFSALNYEQWEQFIRQTIIPEESDIIRQVYREEGEENPLPTAVMLTVDLRTDELYVANQSWKNAVLSATLADGAITVNQFSIELPGESSLSLFGVISPAPTQDLRFEGSMETQGKSLRNVLTVLDPSAKDLPETGFGSFFSHSNIFLSSEQLRLSEADVKLGDLRLNGGMVFYFDAQPRVEADVKLKNINFDYFRDAWRERESKNIDKGKDFFLKYDKSMNFNWLRRLTTTIDFRVNVSQFTFLEHPGSNASFRIYARNGDFGVYDINFIYPTDIMRGTFRLNVNGEKPLINLSFSASEINTDYFSYESTFLSDEDKQKKKEADERKALKEAQARKEEHEDRETGRAPAAIANTPEAPITEPAAMDEAGPGDALKAIEPPGAAPAMQSEDDGGRLVITPQSQRYVQPEPAADDVVPARPATGLDDLLNRSPRARIDTPVGGGKLTELLDMGWMNGISGVIDLNIARLVHRDVTLGNFRLQANFSNDLLNFKTLTFNYWGGQCSIAGSMYGGKVPGFSVSLAFLNGDLHEVLHDLTGRDNITGGISVSATLATSGVNYLSWIQQAEGKMVLVGRGVNVRGFNLNGVVDAVNMSRTSSDVANSVTMIIGTSNTNFSVDGNVNIKNGMLRTPGMNLRSETIMGSLTGEVRMLKWEMDMTTMFQFPEMSSETIPTMTVQLSGPLDKGELRTDTSSLEAYVAKRIISK